MYSIDHVPDLFSRLIVRLATALCDFGYTIYQGTGGGSAAPYQYLTRPRCHHGENV